MRLNRRGLGTGPLGRIVPAGLLLVTAGAALLTLSSHPRTSANGPAFDRPLTASTSLAAKSQLNYGHLPLMFEPNQGQTDPRVRFIARGGGYGLFLTEQEAVLSLQSPGSKTEARQRSVVRMRLAGSNQHPAVNGAQMLPGKSSYFLGNDPSRWRTSVPQYARVEYAQIYPGVDLVYYGSQGRLEYDFQVAPGTDPKTIQLTFDGSRALKLDAGELVLETAAGDIRLEAPRVYQQDGNTRKPVSAQFTLLAADRVGFEIAAYDPSRTLVIDPVLTYSTYLGGSGSELHPTITVDSALDMYVTGATSSTDFPVTDGSTLKAGATTNVFVAKFDPMGANLLFATYIGGTGADSPVGIAVDAATNIYVAGTTTSTDFPTSTTAFQQTPNAPGNPHAFVTQLNGSGTLGYSTYLSGGKTDTATGMTLDNKGFVYVIGITNSTDFPLAPVAGTFQSTLQGTNAFFISKVAPTSTGANSLNFSTYFGGGFPTTGTVTGGAIAVDNNANVSNIYFTGGTTYLFTGQNSQTDFPIRNAFQSCLGNPTLTTCPTSGSTVANADAFVAKLNPGITTGAQLLYCTYLGGASTDIGLGIGLDASGNAYVTGSTDSTDHPAISGNITAYQPNLKGGTDAFVAKINNPATGTGGSTTVQLTYFSYLGGSGNDVGNAIAVDNVQGAEVVGSTQSADFPVKNAFQGSLKGSQDAFVARLDTLGASSSEYVSFLGGTATETGTGVFIDTDSNVYVTGETTSTDFPTVNPKQGTKAGGAGVPDAFVTKLGPSLSFTVLGHSPTANSINAGNQIAFNYQITNNGDTTANVAFIDNLSGGNGSAPVTFVSASVSGGSCAATPTDNKVLCNLGTIKGGGTTSVTINLTPTGGGTVGNSGTLSVGAYSTTAVAPAVSVNTFRLEALTNSNTVVAGNPASYPIKLTPLTNFTASISIACSAGLPTSGTTCTPSTNPVTLQGSSPSTVTLVISTTPRVTTTASTPSERGLFYASWLPMTGIAFLGIGVGSRLRRGRRVLGGLLFIVVSTLILLQPACGGHSSTTTTTGTPAGTYTVNVVASSGSFSQTTPIILVVQ
ncbi:MAG TPA: SBBP repeat-containing protein [Terriglobales bacterium]|nr:SBBP repeat-containing protein [Terriglobales bacterium]